MVQPKTVKTSSTSQFVVVAVKILLVLLILFLLPKLVEAKRRRKDQPRRTAIEARKLRLHCETQVCGACIMEENLNCVSMCLSPACFETVYGNEPLEDGELDFERTKQFDDCFMEESRNARKRRNNQRKK
uniref:Uncharacterized protein n=1 Tax=Amphora coffeiformis TaxID=265554 RepID=A0A7S3P5K9_9STRA|mmetsp:Transcript_7246/g.13826  ORF Transcript_7246/g.13826 Transcript_7246/m.13826 type:complete len:130 (+) Transcript_7246:144-533(+)